MGNLPSNTTERSQHEVEDREFMRKTHMEDHGCWVNIGILHSFHSNRHIILHIVHIIILWIEVFLYSELGHFVLKNFYLALEDNSKLTLKCILFSPLCNT